MKTDDLRLAAFLVTRGYTVSRVALNDTKTMLCVEFEQEVPEDEVLSFELGAVAPAKSLLATHSAFVRRGTGLRKQAKS